MRRLAILLVVVTGVAACSSRTVNFDYERQADFSKYKTFAWQKSTGLSRTKIHWPTHES